MRLGAGHPAGPFEVLAALRAADPSGRFPPVARTAAVTPPGATTSWQGTVGVSGTGHTAGGIVEAVARSGRLVRVLARKGSGVRLLERVAASLDRTVTRGRLDEAGKAAILRWVSMTENAGDLADAHVVLEAVAEDLRVKAKVMGRLAPPDGFGGRTAGQRLRGERVRRRRASGPRARRGSRLPPERAVNRAFMSSAPMNAAVASSGSRSSRISPRRRARSNTTERAAPAQRGRQGGQGDVAKDPGDGRHGAMVMTRDDSGDVLRARLTPPAKAASASSPTLSMACVRMVPGATQQTRTLTDDRSRAVANVRLTTPPLAAA